MRKLLPLLAAALIVSTARATPADTAFESAAKAFLEDYLRIEPESATDLGDHRYDDTLSDYSDAATAAHLALWRKHLGALDRIDPVQLTGPNRTDARIMRTELEAMVFSITEQKSREWNPLFYNSSLSNAIYQLTARDFAPAEVRLKNIAGRLAALPGVVAQIKATLRHPPRVHTETAIQQTAGGISFLQTGLDPLLEKAPALKAQIAPLQARAIVALEDYKRWLEKDVLPTANGDLRLGAEKFRQKLRYALDSDIAMEEVLARAERELESTTAAMYETALPLFGKFLPAAGHAAQQDRAGVIKAVLDQLAETRASDETVVARCQQLVDDATSFVRQHDLVTLPSAPLKVIELPEFQRGVAVAYCQSPGALEPNEQTFFAVSPTPKGWTEARRTSFFREYNDYMLHDLTVHEAMPGHYLQLAHANQFKAPTMIRAIFASGTFVEGWAVYTERVMAEAGFGGPEVKMQQLKMRLRAIINAIREDAIADQRRK